MDEHTGIRSIYNADMHFPFVVYKGNRDIFTVKDNGEFILRGKRIAVDKEVAFILRGVGMAIKEMKDKLEGEGYEDHGEEIHP